ncbi:RagB/SusD family nutrient uptake outer membrane protein, partial [uncultured Alistipes sp.]
MKNILKISAAAAAMTLALSGCIKDATPTQIATEDQVTLETLVRGIPAALVMYNSTGYAQDGAAWDFSLPAIHLATESMTGDLVVTGNIGYDWFTQWGTNVSLGSDYAVGALTWDNYYTWIMMANNVIKQIDASDFSSLDATQRSYLGFAYTYRAMFYLDLVRLYEFKENTVTEAPELLGLGVPVVLPETTEAEAKNNPRAKVDDIYDKVIFP